MAEYLIQDTTLDALADAINAKTGGSSAMTPAEMVTEIGSIETGGGTVIEVPDGYTQLEYLESSGTQYILTPYNAKLNSRAVVKFALLKGCPQYGSAFGTRQPWFMFVPEYAITTDSLTQITVLAGFGNNTNVGCFGVANSQFVVDISKNGTLVNGFNTMRNSGSSALSESSTKIALFARGELNFIVPCRIWRYTYYENDVMLLDMLPAMRNSDNVLGMYDLVNDVFYTNDGTGVFTGGALS